MPRHYLYLTNTRLVSMIAARGAIASRREYEVSEAGVAEFDRQLASMAPAPIHLITDLAEEDLRADTIPHVGAGDREAVVGRKLGQIYRTTPFRHALVMGRESEGRRDDRVVYIAITNPDEVKVWLDVIERREAPLAGIHSAAVLGTRVIEALALASRPHVLLVHFSPGGALRQSYFRMGELRFTRLTPVDQEEGRTLGSIIADETARTWQYLDNLRSFAANDRLEVTVLAHPRHHAEILPALTGFTQLAYQLVDTDQLAARAGLKPAPPDSSAEQILVALFEKKAIANHFASPEMRRFWTLGRARSVITTASAAILLAGLVFGALNLAQILLNAQKEKIVVQEATNYDREFERTMRSLPRNPVGGAAMHDAVAFYASFIERFPSPGGFLVPLSGVLEAHPNVRLAQIAWQATDDPKAVPAMAVGPPRTPPPVKASGKGAEAALRPPAEDIANAPFAVGRYEVALVEATVRVPTQDFRSAIAEVDALASGIGAIKGFAADVVESPLDQRTSLVLQGRDAEREAGSMEARFILRVVRTHEAGA